MATVSYTPGATAHIGQIMAPGNLEVGDGSGNALMNLDAGAGTASVNVKAGTGFRVLQNDANTAGAAIMSVAANNADDGAKLSLFKGNGVTELCVLGDNSGNNNLALHRFNNNAGAAVLSIDESNTGIRFVGCQTSDGGGALTYRVMVGTGVTRAFFAGTATVAAGSSSETVDEAANTDFTKMTFVPSLISGTAGSPNAFMVRTEVLTGPNRLVFTLVDGAGNPVNADGGGVELSFFGLHQDL